MKRYRFLLGAWLLSDLVLFIGSYVLAYFLRVGFILSTDFPFDRFLITVLIVAPFSLAVLATTRTFTLSRKQTELRNFAYIIYSGVVGLALFTLAYYFQYSTFFSRLLLMYALAIQVVATWVWHIVFDNMKRHLLRRSPPAFPTLIVGITRESRALLQDMRHHISPFTAVAIIEPQGSKDTEIEGVPVVGKLNKLEETLEKLSITHVIQCSELEQSINLLSACRNRGITYMLLPSVLGIVEKDGTIESVEGHAVTVVRPTR